MDNFDGTILERLLRAVGEHLEAAGVQHSILVVGGAALILRRWVPRTTEDVDVLALVSGDEQAPELSRPDFPESLDRAVATVARDFGVRRDWCNAQVGGQWHTGLPDVALDGIEWHEFGALRVGLAGRQALIALKLIAAAVQSPQSVHTQDLVALTPGRAELLMARAWVVGQDRAPEFPHIVDQVIEHVLSRCQDR